MTIDQLCEQQTEPVAPCMTRHDDAQTTPFSPPWTSAPGGR